MNGKIDLDNPAYYENRELSWLSFNQRVLEEAMNPDNPLFERLKFLAITSSNLDEFFMVRVASLKEQVSAEYDKPDYAGMLPGEQLAAISLRVHGMVQTQMRHLERSLLPLLKKSGIELLEPRKLNREQASYVEKYFNDVIYPVLTPLAVDSGRPFPLILNKSLNIAVLLEHKEELLFATVQVPGVLPRLVEVPANGNGGKCMVLLEKLIMDHVDRLFIGYQVLSKAPYRITRNADLSIDEEEAEDLLLEIEKSIKKRKWGEAIRLEVDGSMDQRLLSLLKGSVRIADQDLYRIGGPIDLTFLMKMVQMKGFEQLKFPPFESVDPKDLLGVEDYFQAIREGDVFLSHPFESFRPVVEFITGAARDSKVLAIKQTLYRVSGQSPIIRALAEAAEAGKQVTVLVELKARFDEENNIQWARRLEKAGCHVIYGLVGLKTHSKVTLVVRAEEDGIRRYVHLGTGNYNDITARLYTDMGLFTCNEKIGADVSAVFNTLSGYSEPPQLYKLAMAPTGMREKFNYLIRREAANAAAGRPARIVAKMNSLCDLEIMQELYRASMAGVEVELVVRGICSLIPGIPEVSDKITVRSIVGKYLEHSRVFYFLNDGHEEFYLSSADWMPRNLNRRVELLFPVEDPGIKGRLKGMMEVWLKDVVKAKMKDSECIYKRIDRRGKAQIESQSYFEEEAVRNRKSFVEGHMGETFVPVTGKNLPKEQGNRS
ncbi:RNA degradosome polyphosphate kinase [Anaerotalea alkaliphila]|uniref:Polyphosphate kinase n=1 Tax=Anaerotalea alkaliphila TaxID=2662126 RepID=A0A7X5HW32_9FIRM|nr:RNA degradosome polyphosphate kinase [Anaerotalea alkaliphila]NDL67663.1 RNA degradosome polyphosphate kinase [Anaerotalea alkaliphila]